MSSQPSEKIQGLLQSSNPSSPNFTSEHSVVLAHPLAEAFRVLAVGTNMEKVVRLSDLCTDFELFHEDHVQQPNTPFSSPASRFPESITFRTAQSTSIGLPRQFFRLQETDKGIKVDIAGTQTWDIDSNACLYETMTDKGVHIWKMRVFEALPPIEGGGEEKTAVHEMIRGHCGPLMKLLVPTLTRKAHQEQMEQYHTLF